MGFFRPMAYSYDDGDLSVTVPPELDEYICDYVDGTMDDAVRDAFEDYLAANPDVAAHVARLVQTTDMLRACADQCPCVAEDFQTRLQCAVENECTSEEESGAWLDRVSGVVLVTSALTIVCLAVLVPRMSDISEAGGADVVATASAVDRDGPVQQGRHLNRVPYHTDRPAMERSARSLFETNPALAFQLQPTYRDLPAESAYLAAGVSP